VGGFRKESFWRALFEDPAGVEEDDSVSDVAREAHLVRSDEHRHSALS
jgi:hypothetical protein